MGTIKLCPLFQRFLGIGWWIEPINFRAVQASCDTSLEFKVPTEGLLEQKVIYGLA